MKIHDIQKGKNRFCGPAAVSAVTGRPVDEIVEVFHAKTDKSKVMGTSHGHLEAVLNEYGLMLFHRSRFDRPGRPTLAQWLRTNKADRTAGRVYLIAAGHHWLVVSGRKAVCGTTIKVVSVREYPGRRKRVEDVFEVLPCEDGGRTRSTPKVVVERRKEKQAKARVRSREYSAISALRRRAKAAGITIEKTDDYWEVYPPETLYLNEAGTFMEEDDPFEGDHFAYSESEVRTRVERYVTDARAASCTKTG